MTESTETNLKAPSNVEIVFRYLRAIFLKIKQITFELQSGHALLVELVYQSRLKSHSNPFASKYAKRYFSQSDEDGITIEILSRMSYLDDLTPTFFLEFGVGNGTENNTLVLLSSGQCGTWVGGQKLSIDFKSSERLHFIEKWVTLKNIIQIYQDSLNTWSIDQFDLISMDLDGNDFHFISSLLDHGCRPSVFICEYNAIFPPIVSWTQPYDPDHVWTKDQYFGVSLAKLNSLFSEHGYFLCACNPQTGSNAFFIQNSYRDLFPEVPNAIEDIYVTPFYNFDNTFSHHKSVKFINNLLNSSS